MKKIITIFLLFLFHANISLCAELNQDTSTQDTDNIKKYRNTLPRNFTPSRRTHNYLPRNERLKVEKEAQKMALRGIRFQRAYQENPQCKSSYDSKN